MKTKPAAIVFVLLSTFLTASAQIFFKFGARNLELSTLITNYNLMIGIALYVVAGVILITALKYGELSVLYPIIATSFIWVSFLSIKFLGETMNVWKWLGVFAIMIGVSIIAKGSKEDLVAYVEAV